MTTPINPAATQGKGASANADRAGRASPEPASSLGHTATIPCAFTPGPWEVEADGQGEFSIWTRQPHIGILASTFPDDINGDFPAEANARLIAAAPELYAAANAAFDFLGGVNGAADIRGKLLAAILKASGQ